MFPSVLNQASRALTLGLMLALGPLGAGALQAQPAPSPGAGAANPAEQAVLAMRDRLQGMAQELNQIRTEAMERHPDLAERQQALEQVIQDAMRKYGIDPQPHIEAMQALKARTEDTGLAEDARREAAGKLQGMIDELRGAQQRAMEDPQVQGARKAFSEALMAALNAVDPQIEDKLRAMNEAQQEFQALVRKTYGPGN